MAIRRIDKAYFPLEEVLAEWELSKFDLLYLVETGGLRLSVRVMRLNIEQGEYEEPEQGNSFPIPVKQGKHTGIVDLYESDARTILLKGKAEVSWFYVPNPYYLSVDTYSGSIEIEKNELLITKVEKMRFEGNSGKTEPDKV